jgi:hypothetical protein
MLPSTPAGARGGMTRRGSPCPSLVALRLDLLPSGSLTAHAATELHITANWTAIAKFDGAFGSGAQTCGGTGALKYLRRPNVLRPD